MKDLKHVQRATGRHQADIGSVENNPAGDNIEEETRWGPRQAINICLLQLQY